MTCGESDKVDFSKRQALTLAFCLAMSTVRIDVRAGRFPRYVKQLQLEDVSGHVELVVLIHKQQVWAGFQLC